jgi:hypothetical protein
LDGRKAGGEPQETAEPAWRRKSYSYPLKRNPGKARDLIHKPNHKRNRKRSARVQRTELTTRVAKRLK